MALNQAPFNDLRRGAHLYAAYQHWTARDFGVNPEHPPLVKLVAALPLLGMKIKPPTPPRFMFLPEQYLGADQMLADMATTGS